MEKIIEVLKKLNAEIDEEKVKEACIDYGVKGRVAVASAVLKYLIDTGQTKYTYRQLKAALGIDVKNIARRLYEKGLVSKKYSLEIKTDADVEAKYNELARKYNYSRLVLYAIAELMVRKDINLREVSKKYNVSEQAVRRAFRDIFGLKWSEVKKRGGFV